MILMLVLPDLLRYRVAKTLLRNQPIKLVKNWPRIFRKAHAKIYLRLLNLLTCTTMITIRSKRSYCSMQGLQNLFFRLGLGERNGIVWQG